MNSILMMNWSDFWSCLIRLISAFTVLFLVVSAESSAQNLSGNSFTNPSSGVQPQFYRNINYGLNDTTVDASSLPNPKSVLYKSLIIPGWGQVVNKQVWKVPIVYGLLAGLTGYSIFLTKRYHDYRAAFYNENATLNPDDEFPNDMRFGSTPDFLAGVTNLSSLQSNRNNFRNRRDFIYVTIVLAYGLNAIDAFIFAHLRSFDVSEDLSLRPTLKPDILAQSSPGVTLSIELFNKNK